MIDPSDLATCREAIRHGSLSFHAASRLLPRRVREPALALYAFCRLADDAVDLGGAKADAVLRLADRLDAIYAGQPRDAAADRAFAAVVADFEMPRALPDALLEGLAWDAQGRQYGTLADLHAYSARVASAVGAMMTVLMGVRDADALARACDLGVAMQLTNIARDVGEDARAGRLYLPLAWMDEAGIDVGAFLADPQPTTAVRGLVRRLLAEADRLYYRAEAGIPFLPLDARPGIYAARHVYAGIGGAVRANGHDSVTQRARTTGRQKLGWLSLSLTRTALTLALPRPAVIYARALPETQFLVDAAARTRPGMEGWGDGRAGALLSALADLKARDGRTQPVLVQSR